MQCNGWAGPQVAQNRPMALHHSRIITARCCEMMTMITVPPMVGGLRRVCFCRTLVCLGNAARHSIKRSGEETAVSVCLSVCLSLTGTRRKPRHVMSSLDDGSTLAWHRSRSLAASIRGAWHGMEPRRTHTTVVALSARIDVGE